MSAPNPLRAISQRLNLTPVENLPQYAGSIATSIFSSSHLFLAEVEQKSDNAVLIHKIKTRISALLQDRSAQGRFAGTVLIKALIEAGGHSMLTSSGPWVRSLLTCLCRSEPPEVKKLYLITITRIFILTEEHQTLVREITVPSLPAFITSTLNLAKPREDPIDGSRARVLSPLLPTILRCWSDLILNFSSTFRPFTTAIRSICMSAVGDSTCARNIKTAAAEVLARLHYCAPKSNAVQEWALLCEQCIEATHEVADYIFRSVQEDWLSNTSRVSKLSSKLKSGAELSSKDDNILGLSRWTGMYEGCLRSASLLHLLTAMTSGPQSQVMTFPLSPILNLISRYAAVTVPTKKFVLKANPEISRDEREALWMTLPHIHCAVLVLLKSITGTFQQAVGPTSRTIFMQCWDIFEAEKDHSEIRESSYSLLVTLLNTRTLKLTRTDMKSMSVLVQSCCDDICSQIGLNNGATKATTNGKSSHISTGDTLRITNSVSQSNTSFTNAKKPKSQPSLFEAAWNLLPILLSTIPSSIMPSATRTLLDKTAILAGHSEAMLASVLNPPTTRGGTKAAPSIIPFLAASTHNLSTEALLRPRMPVIIDKISTTHDNGPAESPEDEDEPTEPVEYQTAHPPSAFDGPDALFHHISEPIEQTPQTTSEVIPTETRAVHDPTPPKRDFTSIVEANLDSQIGSSEPESAAKRARLVETDPTSSSAGPVDVEESGEQLQNSLMEEISRETEVPMENKVRRVGDDSNDESDFEMPTIDPTMTDDEDDDDDDEMDT